MSTRRENLAIVGVGAACVACCAGPILGVLAAIGIGTAAGFALFGSVALVLGAIVGIVVLRRRRPPSCDPAATPVTVETPTVRTRA